MLQRDWSAERGRGLSLDQRAEPVPVPHRHQHANGDHYTAKHERPAPQALAAPANDGRGGGWIRTVILGVSHGSQSHGAGTHLINNFSCRRSPFRTGMLATTLPGAGPI